MKVLLATSPHVQHAAVLQNDFQPAPGVMYGFLPLGLLSLAGTLRERMPEAHCALFDTNRRIASGQIPLDTRFYQALGSEIASRKPDVVGIMTECDSYHHVLQIAAAVKREIPSAKIVLGGPHASAVAAETLSRHQTVDAVVVGEGEFAFWELLASYQGHGEGGAIPGVVQRYDKRREPTPLVFPRQVNTNGRDRALVDNLDDLAYPAFDLYQPSEGEEVFLEVGRGCPFQCEFCSTAPFWQRKHRVKSPRRIVEEVRTVQRAYASKRVHFTHDLFTTNRAWVMAVCDALIDVGSPVNWTCSARTDTVDFELLERMAKGGCTAVYFGFESGSQRILREIRKDIPVERSFEVIEMCRQVGISPNVGFIVGFPSEDAGSFEATLGAFERSLRAGARPAHIFGYCPFAASSLYPKLTGLVCTGHFVDLPLDPALDGANRELIAGDQDLFGAYYRPPFPGEGRDWLEGVDEFSPLVESVLAPSLALAERSGGMAAVFRDWQSWIRARNEARSAAPFRRTYGSPAAFAEFVLQGLKAGNNPPRPALAAAEALWANLRIAEENSPGLAATAMASYRTASANALDRPASVTLGTQLAKGSVLASLALDFDVSPALEGRSALEYAETPFYLVWHVNTEGKVRLLSVDNVIFEILESLQEGPLTVADWMIAYTGKGGAENGVDAETIMASLNSALDEELVNAS